jgi:hypothetical protein
MWAMSSIIDQFHVPRELTIEFLGTFSRFEYALKRSGYLRGDKTRIDADWDQLGGDLSSADQKMLSPVLACCEYLREKPPKKQVLVDGQLAWKSRGASGGSEIEEVLLSVRTVRNNVFHGGKYPEGPVAEPLRDEQLIRDCLAVMYSLLASPILPAGISGYFWSEG